VKRLLYTAAHSGFNLGQIPLGGGAAICEHLTQEWTRTKPFEFQVLGPELLQSKSPQHKDLVQYSELAYARFCRHFERSLTDAILKHNPQDVLILSNDVSEGPDFKQLAERGHSLFTIYHVDVVDYFCRIYLRSRVQPNTTTAFYRQLLQWKLGPLVPDVLKLVWEKQEASVRYSKGLIVPSMQMKELLLRCYPEVRPDKVHVLPWGVWEETISADDVQAAKKEFSTRYPMPPGALKLLLLSRISPEKGQHLLLEALALWEKQKDFPAEGVALYLSGEPAYMMGKKYESKLKRLAKKLSKTVVHFVGYAAGAKKKAIFSMSDIYVFPSIHESYGLTMLEALRAGLPVLATPSHGAKEIFQAEFGEMARDMNAQGILAGLKRLAMDRSGLKKRGAAGERWAKDHDFSAVASKLAALLASQ
jgi:glycosyltransferase involved in cell wall biosynthesis